VIIARLSSLHAERASAELQNMMSSHFLVEANHRIVGLAVRVRGGFRFVASDQRFRALDGKVYPKLRTIDRLAALLSARSPAGVA
jgi:hypothetical protein